MDTVGNIEEATCVLLKKASSKQEIEHQNDCFGISSFLRFFPFRDLCETQGYLEESLRDKIAQSLHRRFIEIFVAQLPDDPLMEQFREALRVTICPRPKPGFNNNEVHLWFLDIPFLKEGFVFKILNNLRDSTSTGKNPIVVEIKGKDHEVIFIGWGLHYYW